MEFHQLIFSSYNNYYAMAVDNVVRTMRIVETTPLPESPHILFGIFDLQGQTTPVVSLRRLLSLPEKEIELEDIFIITNVHTHQIALMVDHVEGVFVLTNHESAEAKELFPELIFTESVKWHDKLIPVVDIEAMIDKEIVQHIASKVK